VPKIRQHFAMRLKDTSLPRRAEAVGVLPTRSARSDGNSGRCCAAGEAVAFWLGSFGAHPSFIGGVARRRAVKAVPENKGGYV
jgi:hypothetical protein